ncbi:MAG TPA: hypothetical protein VFQ61_07935 [Polyangiaceae bacterium]|nr:hypothetical protein [Polyangiaceae bacterium]
MNWLSTLWAQYFRREQTISCDAFLSANLVLGCFFSIVLFVALKSLDLSSAITAVLVAAMVPVHLAGLPLSKARPARTRSILLVQGLTLGAAVIAMVIATSVEIAREPVLRNIRYLPGLSVSLLTYAGLEVEFGLNGQASVRSWRRVGLGLGMGGEILLLSCIIGHFVR